MEKKTAIIIGATGLVGNMLLQQLLQNENYGKIKIFVRKKIDLQHEKLEQQIIDFENPEKLKQFITGDELFSVLGTTLKKAGSKDAQYKVDYTYQYEFAKIASENNVKSYFLVSSAGANENSRSFYMKMKAELDRDVQKLQFKNIQIFRPSALAGKRKETRITEILVVKIGTFLARLFPKFRKYRPIHGYIVARGLVNLANNQKAEEKTRAKIYQYEEIFDIAGISHKLKSITILQ